MLLPRNRGCARRELAASAEVSREHIRRGVFTAEGPKRSEVVSRSDRLVQKERQPIQLELAFTSEKRVKPESPRREGPKTAWRWRETKARYSVDRQWRRCRTREVA